MSSETCFLNIKFDRNSFIGFDQEEIENTANEDLLTIRNAAYKYLKSTKLKKRNANFMEVYYRTNKELKKRKINVKKEFTKKQLPNCDKALLDIFEMTPSTSSNWSDSSETDEKAREKERKTEILKFFNVEIPNFLNDKNYGKFKRDTGSDMFKYENKKDINFTMDFNNQKINNNLFSKNTTNKNSCHGINILK
jgi:hypothetical protein